jgi:GT2 family glycosyltransferase
LIEKIGPYDESLLSNEDYEFNVRIRKAGGKVWLDPAIKTIYFARRSIKELARQYWRYGYWKAQMLRRYPETIRWRQLAALLVLSLAGLGFLSLLFPWARWILGLEILVYSGALLAAGLQVGLQKRDLALSLGVPLAIATMHFTWGTAFLWSTLIILLSSRQKNTA